MKTAKGGTWPSGLTIERPRLLEQLMSADEPLVVISAPAGYGKTTLVRQWAARDDRPFAWLRLLAEDNDPEILAEHLTRAVLTAVEFGEGRAKPAVTLASPVGRHRQTELVSAVSNSDPLVIVLDDVEQLVAFQPFARLEAVLDVLGLRSHLVIVGRVKPALRLAHMRAHYKVREIGPDDLAFEPEESARLVEATGLRLTAKATAVLVGQAEGWPAGLSLAARSLRSRRDPESAARGFDGDDRLVAEYLAETIDGLDQAIIDFLLETSVLERFCAGLCDAIRQRRGSSRIIEALGKANLFIVPLDHTGDWYRYHHLFAGFLRSERRRNLGEDEALLQARASHWWEQHGDRDSAVRHAFASGDLDRFEMLVWSSTPISLHNGGLENLAAWLELPTVDQVMAKPGLALAAGWLSLILERGQTGPLTANLADRAGSALPDGAPLGTVLALIRAAKMERGPAGAVADATAAYKALENDDPWKACACLYRGTALRLAGRPRPARAALQEGHDRAAIMMPALATSCLLQLAWAAVDEGDWAEAESYTSRARARLESSVASRPVDLFAINATSALLLARSGKALASHNFARLALDEVPTGAGPGASTIEAQLILARALVLLSDHANARDVLRQARARLARLPDAGVLTEKTVDAEAIVAAAFAASPIPDPLSPAEMRVLHYLPSYMTFEEISRELIVSRTTVKTQAIAVYRKLGVNSRAEAVRKAQQQGLLSA